MKGVYAVKYWSIFWLRWHHCLYAVGGITCKRKCRVDLSWLRAWAGRTEPVMGGTCTDCNLVGGDVQRAFVQ